MAKSTDKSPFELIAEQLMSSPPPPAEEEPPIPTPLIKRWWEVQYHSPIWYYRRDYIVGDITYTQRTFRFLGLTIRHTTETTNDGTGTA